MCTTQKHPKTQIRLNRTFQRPLLLRGLGWKKISPAGVKFQFFPELPPNQMLEFKMTEKVLSRDGTGVLYSSICMAGNFKTSSTSRHPLLKSPLPPPPPSADLLSLLPWSTRPAAPLLYGCVSVLHRSLPLWGSRSLAVSGPGAAGEEAPTEAPFVGCISAAFDRDPAWTRYVSCFWALRDSGWVNVWQPEINKPWVLEAKQRFLP